MATPDIQALRATERAARKALPRFRNPEIETPEQYVEAERLLADWKRTHEALRDAMWQVMEQARTRRKA